MFAKPFVTGVGTVAACAGLVIAGSLLTTAVHADDEHGESDNWRIEVGLEIAPVHLTYAKHDRKLVGLGSYIVNAVSECNGCHSAGPMTQFTAGHNPYFRLGTTFTPPKMDNPLTYLGGGRDFGQLQGDPAPHIVSRNLTPDKSGLPIGGASFGEFYETIRTGRDPDQLHPNCSATVTTNCFNPPFDGRKLQVMPWPAYQDWTDRELLAVYSYLKAIPCIPGPGHDCF